LAEVTFFIALVNLSQYNTAYLLQTIVYANK